MVYGRELVYEVTIQHSIKKDMATYMCCCYDIKNRLSQNPFENEVASNKKQKIFYHFATLRSMHEHSLEQTPDVKLFAHLLHFQWRVSLFELFLTRAYIVVINEGIVYCTSFKTCVFHSYVKALNANSHDCSKKRIVCKIRSRCTVKFMMF